MSSRLLTKVYGCSLRTQQRGVLVAAKRSFSTNDETQGSSSSTKEFRSLPVDSSLLEYIQSIGVGIPKRKTRAQATNERRSEVMNANQEKAFFDRNRRQRQTTVGVSGKQGSSKIVIVQELPPAPFGVPTDVRRKPVKVVARVGSLQDDNFPSNNQNIPEIALAGRSNVGKSSLLNALLYGDATHLNTGGRARSNQIHQKAKRGIKADTSPIPGETKKLSFYQLSTNPDDRLWLVDLPGYGFAYDSGASVWQECTAHYLLERGKNLKRILVLLDARHGMKKADVDFLTTMESTLFSSGRRQQLPPLQLVLTKCDLVSQSDLARRVMQVERQLSDCLRRQPSNLPVLLVSIKPEQRGVIELQKELAALVPIKKVKKENKK